MCPANRREGEIPPCRGALHALKIIDCHSPRDNLSIYQALTENFKSGRQFMDRRAFIASAGAAAAVVASGRAGAAMGANDKIGIALIGARNMGWSDLCSAMSAGGANIVSIADADKTILDRRGAEAGKKFGAKPALYSDYRRALDRRDVDAVIIGTPDHWHCLQFCDACSAGKDVYVEKPIANSIAECDAMTAFARKFGRVVSVGQQQDSSKMWRRVIDMARGGKLGRISRVDVWANFRYGGGSAPAADSNPPAGLDYGMWLGPAPARPFNPRRLHGSWRLFWDYGGGLMTDWGVHLLDMAAQGLGKDSLPRRVSGAGGKFAHPETSSQTFDTLNVVYDFGDSSIAWSNTTVPVGFYGMSYGVAFNGEKGVLAANREGWKTIPNPGVKTGALKGESGKPENGEHLDHLKDFLDAVRSRRFKTACTIENGAFCAKLAHLGNISARVGKTLSYDDAAKTFSDAEADGYLRPRYRAPWKFPEA